MCQLHMNTSYRIIPCYTGDVSGVCSALFELGGMVVIHDPSGCNSTYNTHDETRWYDHNSLIFISGLAEIDAVFGNDDKLIDDTVDAAMSLHPKFITLVNSPIPFLNGTDFEAICRVIESRTGIPTFYIPTNGMHDYVPGAGHGPGGDRPAVCNGTGTGKSQYREPPGRHAAGFCRRRLRGCSRRERGTRWFFCEHLLGHGRHPGDPFPLRRGCGESGGFRHRAQDCSGAAGALRYALCGWHTRGCIFRNHLFRHSKSHDDRRKPISADGAAAPNRLRHLRHRRAGDHGLRSGSAGPARDGAVPSGGLRCLIWSPNTL